MNNAKKVLDGLRDIIVAIDAETIHYTTRAERARKIAKEAIDLIETLAKASPAESVGVSVPSRPRGIQRTGEESMKSNELIEKSKTAIDGIHEVMCAITDLRARLESLCDSLGVIIPPAPECDPTSKSSSEPRLVQALGDLPIMHRGQINDCYEAIRAIENALLK